MKYLDRVIVCINESNSHRSQKRHGILLYSRGILLNACHNCLCVTVLKLKSNQNAAMAFVNYTY